MGRPSKTLEVTFTFVIPEQVKRSGIKGALQSDTLRRQVNNLAAPVFIKEMQRLGLAPGEAIVKVVYGLRQVDSSTKVSIAKKILKRVV